jgi:Uma2 family endonuclease
MAEQPLRTVRARKRRGLAGAGALRGVDSPEMPPPEPLPDLEPAPEPPEQRIVIRNVTWKQYATFRDTVDRASLRMTYCRGVLEIMAPSELHEIWKTSIARVVEYIALERDWPLDGYGSTTFRDEVKDRGCEPDECYYRGRAFEPGSVPDIVLEVIHTRPLLDKLEVYKGLGVREVWVFKRGVFELYLLEGGEYRRIEKSHFLPELDFDLVKRVASRRDQHAAMRELREMLRRG